MIERNRIAAAIKRNYIIFCGLFMGWLYWLSDIAMLHGGFLEMELHHRIMRWLAFATIVSFGIVINYMVTKSRRLEKEAQTAGVELEQIFQTAADGMRIIGKNFAVLRANQAFLKMTGLAEEEVIGRKCYQVFAGPKCRTPECPMLAILKGKEVNEIESEVTRKDGTKLTCIITSTPFRNPDGEVIGIVEDIKDITQRKKLHESLVESEERLRELFDNTTNLIQSVGPDGRILYVNRAWHETLGYDRDEVAGLNIFDLLAPESREHCRTMFKELTDGRRMDSIEATFIAKNGSRVHLEGNASCKLVDGKPLYTRSIFQNVTERKRAEEVKERLILDLQQAIDEIETLSGILPICAYCKKIRDDAGYWNKVENYITSRSKAVFSHCICPSCLKIQDPEAAKELLPEPPTDPRT